MKFVIAGTRTIKDYDVVEAKIEASGFKEMITEVVSGCSEKDVKVGLVALDSPPGSPLRQRLNVDILGAIWAIRHGIPVTYFSVSQDEWDAFGKRAGPMRNRRMGNYADGLILVWDGKSRGSSSMLAIAEELNLLKYAPPIVEEDDEEEVPGLWSAAL